ncbi:MAG: hypothetical protein HOE14_17430 [Gemmatimonadales bacterium]|jgi:hypothetical protein|nr:hypothetical protein [Gemmatimonadales bacterium]MBT4188978.1 hypothetical protein [Gemmatimonadales bacterium]MBT7692402.1 hypothetical protein [Gemmatimonadales bacterium]
MLGRLEISRKEWLIVDRVADAICANDVDSTIRLSHHHGQRGHHTGHGCWTLVGWGVVVDVLSRAEWYGTVEVGVPLQLVRHAASLVEISEWCALVLADDGYQYLESPTGASAVVDSPPTPAPSNANFSSVASAFVRAGDLRNAMYSALFVAGDMGDQPPPSLSIGIEEGVVGISCDWRPFGLSKATYRVPAWNVSSSAMSGAVLVTLPALLGLVESPDTAIHVEIGEECVRFQTSSVVDRGFDVDEDYLRDREGGDGWCVSVAVIPTGARRWSKGVSEVLDGSGHYWGWDRPGVASDLGSTGEMAPVQIEFCDTDSEILRLTRVLSDVTDHNPASCHEMAGRLNAAKTELRFWSESGLLVASYDLPCARYAEVASWADRLRDETEGLDVLAASFA